MNVAAPAPLPLLVVVLLLQQTMNAVPEATPPLPAVMTIASAPPVENTTIATPVIGTALPPVPAALLMMDMPLHAADIRTTHTTELPDVVVDLTNHTPLRIIVVTSVP